jgi:hypothetical protein
VAISIRAAKVKDRDTVEDSGGGTITHGSEITASNTGHLAYFDTGLGRLTLNSDMTVHASQVSLSDFVSNGGSMTRHYFQGGLIFDRNNVTLTACRTKGGWACSDDGATGSILNWCTTDTDGQSAGDDGIWYDSYTAYRCSIRGCSDGAKINGNVTMTECYIRCRAQDSADHNDGCQNYAGSGPVTIQRCNVDARPEGGSGGPNAALFAADGANGLMTWNDNLLAGGGYVMRLYENCTYICQGNWVIDNSWDYSPADRAVIPSGNVTWGTVRPNYVVNASTYAVVSTISAP